MKFLLISLFVISVLGHDDYHYDEYDHYNDYNYYNDYNHYDHYSHYDHYGYCCQYVPMRGVGPETSYILFHQGCMASEEEARYACHRYGGFLARVDRNIERTQLASQITLLAPSVRNAYIDSWETNDYGAECITLYANGAITPPAELCAGPLPFICQFNGQVQIQ